MNQFRLNGTSTRSRRGATSPVTQRFGNNSRESQARTARQDSVSDNRRISQSQLRAAGRNLESVNRRSERNAQVARAPEAVQTGNRGIPNNHGIEQEFQGHSDIEFSSGEHQDRQVCIHIVIEYRILTTNPGITEI